MIESIWNLVAKVCARPAFAALLIRQAKKRPYKHIGDYMSRWWLVPRDWKLPFSVRIHHIRRPDADPFLHDHPFSYRTIVLSGWYREEDVFGCMRNRLSGSTKAAAIDTFHRIDEVSFGGVWTLFFMWNQRPGDEDEDWGFMCGNPPRKVHWRKYHSTNNRGELRDEAA